MKEPESTKRVLSIELDDAVKKVSITGLNSENNVIMKQDLDEKDLDQVSGGGGKLDIIPIGFKPPGAREPVNEPKDGGISGGW